MAHAIRFKLFGTVKFFSPAEGQWIAVNSLCGTGIGKKQLAFLVYFLLNHTRKISSSELVEHFWPDNNKDPGNSLKNMIHKTRTLLSRLFPECPELIVTGPGGYAWNPDYPPELDTNLFEALYRASKKAHSERNTDAELQACELFQGDILSGIHADWLAPINTYYRTVYVDICKSLANHLMDEDRWEEVIRVCNQGIALAPEVEDFTACAMHAMIASGVPGQAVNLCENYRAMLWEEYNMVPSELIEKVYKLAVESSKSPNKLEEKLIAQIACPLEEPGSFHCGLVVFQNIVQLELRHMERNSHASCLATIRLESADKPEPSPTDIRRLERILQQTLRAGDPFTRLDLDSFALLLSGATEENSCKVMERIQQDFRASYPRAHVKLCYCVYPLSAGSKK